MMRNMYDFLALPVRTRSVRMSTCGQAASPLASSSALSWSCCSRFVMSVNDSSPALNQWLQPQRSYLLQCRLRSWAHCDGLCSSTPAHMPQIDASHEGVAVRQSAPEKEPAGLL